MKTLALVLVTLALYAATASAAMVQGMPDYAKQQLALGNIHLKTDTLKGRLYVTSATNMTIGATQTCNATGELTNGTNGVANYAPVTIANFDILPDTVNHYALAGFTSPTWSGSANNFSSGTPAPDGMAICDYTLDATNGVLVAYITFPALSVTNGYATVSVPLAAAATYSTAVFAWH